MDQQSSQRWLETLKAEKRAKNKWEHKYLTAEQQQRERDEQDAAFSELGMGNSMQKTKRMSERDAMEARLRALDDEENVPQQRPHTVPDISLLRQRVAAEVAATRARSHRFFAAASLMLLLRCIFAAGADERSSRVMIAVFGALQALLWMCGFIMLVGWLVVHLFPVAGFKARPFIGACVKLCGAILLNVEPVQNLLLRVGAGGTSWPWASLVGIWLLHVGNCVDAVGVTFHFDSSMPFEKANLPVLGMWTWCAATWIFVASASIRYLSLPTPDGHGWESLSLSPVASFVVPGQIAGSLLLLLGSLLLVKHAC